MPSALTQSLAERLAVIALGHVGREYPNKLDHVLDGPAEVARPRALHPIFFGSFDWHSCVHSHWALARLLRLYPHVAPADEIRALFDAQFTPDKVAAERAYLDRPSARGFERPYGWAWLLKLAAELEGLEGGEWARRLAPLAQAFSGRFRNYLPRAALPVRAGAHASSAFALRLATDYAEVVGDARLEAALQDAARRWFADDRACPAWGEPSGEDFLSPVLVEAEAMRRLWPKAAFDPWFDRFLPDLARSEPAVLFAPVAVSDRTDGKIAHLDGLNLSRAWCWRALAGALPAEDPRRLGMVGAAETHLAASLPHLADDYMGEHWLASFALLALS